MAEVVLFHSVLGIRPGVQRAAERLTAAGHVVHVPDRYEGHAPFDSYDDAIAFENRIGFAELVRRTERELADLQDELVYCGWSAGGGLAEHCALNRPGARGLVLISSAAKLSWFDAAAWPGTVPVQLHYATDDPFREEDELRTFMEEVESSGAACELHEYELHGHLFDEPTLPEEFDDAASTLMWSRIQAFLASV